MIPKLEVRLVTQWVSGRTDTRYGANFPMTSALLLLSLSFVPTHLPNSCAAAPQTTVPFQSSRYVLEYEISVLDCALGGYY